MKFPLINLKGTWSLYRFEMKRAFRTMFQTLIAPVITTSLYFIVFGSAIGSKMSEVNGVSYGGFIVPGLIMLNLLTLSTSNAAFGIYLPKFTGTIYEILSAPISFSEMILAYVGAAATKSIIVGILILITSSFFVDIEIMHPFWMALFLIFTAITFSMLGFIIGLCSNSFEQLQFVPTLVMTPLTFLGGAFYSINILPDFWRNVTLFNPVVYLISGFRWSFYESADVHLGTSLCMTFVFFMICLSIIWWIFKTGWRLKN